MTFDKELLYRFNKLYFLLGAEILLNHKFFGDSYGVLEMSEEESFQVKNNKDLKRVI